MARAIEEKNIVIIGSGNVATQFALNLVGKVKILQVYSPTMEHARELADKIGCRNVTCHPDEVIRDADVYIVAVKDDALHLIAHRFAGSGGLWLHTSGTTSMSVFYGFKSYGVIYPLQTITRLKNLPMSSIPLFIEACDDTNAALVRGLAEIMGAKDIISCSSSQRMKLHVAAVFACNFVNFMLMHAQSLLHDAGSELSAMAPLIQETVAKALADDDLENAQTGPARRGDVHVIARHLSQLEGEAHDLYKFISEKILNHYAHYE